MSLDLLNLLPRMFEMAFCVFSSSGKYTSWVYVERMEDFGARPSVEVWAFDMTGRRWKGVL